MVPEKRSIIVSEIEHWRRSKLLPEQYCIFLLNLYKDDSSGSITKAKSRKLPKGTGKLNWKYGLIAFVVLTVISLTTFYMINFNSFHIGLQISGSVLIIFICYLFGVIKLKHKPIFSYVFLGIGSILLLFIGEYLLQQHGFTDPLWIIGYIVICSIIWISIGWILEIGMLQFAGWAGLLLFYGYLLHSLTGRDVSWLQIQLWWIPFSVIFAWVSWLLRIKRKKDSKVLLAIASILWFVGELYSLFFSELSGIIIQYSMIGKVIALAATIFFIRRKWRDWINHEIIK